MTEIATDPYGINIHIACHAQYFKKHASTKLGCLGLVMNLALIRIWIEGIGGTVASLFRKQRFLTYDCHYWIDS